MEIKTKRTLLNNRMPHSYVLSNPRTLNMEEYKGMGFDENNYSLIPPVSQAYITKYHSKTNINAKTGR